jgi:Uncharacterized protein conserved in bacteria
MHPSVTALASIFRLNTELVLNCIEDLDDERAQERGDPPVNSITFLVAHLTETRHLMARLMGQPLPSPFSQAFGKARTLDEAGPLPSLDDVRAHWERISAHVAVHIERLDTAQLVQSSSQKLPGSDGTLLGALAFLAQHESYHLGQIGILRRQRGCSPMQYRLRPREPGRVGA